MADVFFPFTCPRCGQNNTWWWSETGPDGHAQPRVMDLYCDHCLDSSRMQFDGKVWREVEAA